MERESMVPEREELTPLQNIASKVGKMSSTQRSAMQRSMVAKRKKKSIPGTVD